MEVVTINEAYAKCLKELGEKTRALREIASMKADNEWELNTEFDRAVGIAREALKECE